VVFLADYNTEICMAQEEKDQQQQQQKHSPPPPPPRREDDPAEYIREEKHIIEIR
jgi:hypothetical protein